MTLQFQPPFDILSYRSPEQKRLDSLKETAQILNQTAMQNREQRYRNLMMQLMKTKEEREAKKFGWEQQAEEGIPMPQPSMGMPEGLSFGQQTRNVISPSTTAIEPSMQPSGVFSKFRQWQNQNRKRGPMPTEQPMTAGSPFSPEISAMYGLNRYQLAPERLFKQAKEAQELQTARMKAKAQEKMMSQPVTWKQDPWTGEMTAYPTRISPEGFGMGGGQFPSPARGQGGTGTAGDYSVPFTPGMPAKTRGKLISEKPKATAALKDALNEYDKMITQAERIKNDPSLDWASGLSSWTGTIPGTGAKRVAANMKTLVSQTMLNVMMKLKTLSVTGATGMGQLSNQEGDTMRQSITPLDLSMKEEDVVNNLDYLIKEAKASKRRLKEGFLGSYGNAPGLMEIDEGGGGQGSNTGWSEEKEARYQAWKAGQR